MMPVMQADTTSPHSQSHHSCLSRDTMGSSLSGTPQRAADDGYALEDAENPLQLLARASDLPISRNNMPSAPDPLSPAASSSRTGHIRKQSENQDLHTFFGPFSTHLDVGEDIDPIDMGFITQNETDVLFNLYVT
jgi:hypothetical protein